ncbi:uncharacterized protein EV422DRAFT_512724 [Fimicolochytrium jonesii]|uniref:uncharacterized protein n=1 Tax=Fimicolochytrium jonesii TaxID=1396493 RepID=UPI0022FE6820|nr:uncharacterized protein EV422DRAFT_512724 [Fimicolochytrium jonesii]KAI8827119.1 hypothetical protein EV422DRAFT_512724 [Fimicolochytrium jonesii]
MVLEEPRDKHERRWPRIPYSMAIMVVTLLTAAAITVPPVILLVTGGSSSVAKTLEILQARISTDVSRNVLALTGTCFRTIDDTEAGTIFLEFLYAFSQNISVSLYDFGIPLQLEMMNTADRYGTTTALFTKGGGNTLDAWFVSVNNSVAKLCSNFNVTHVNCTVGNMSRIGDDLLNQTIKYDVFDVILRPKSEETSVKSPTPLERWIPTIWFFLGGRLFASTACGKSLWLRDAPTHPPYNDDFSVQFTAVFNAEVLVTYLATLLPTPNTILALIETTGNLLATNRDNLQVNGAGTGPAHIIDVRQSDLQTAAKLMLARHQNWTLVPASHNERVSMPDKRTLIVTLKRITDSRGLDMILFIVIPEDDLLGQLKTKINSAIVTGVVVTAAMLLIACAMSYFITLPLKTLIRGMQAASNFDFSELRKPGQTITTSVLAELGTLQGTFTRLSETMSKAVDQNRNLVNNMVRQRSQASDNPVSPTRVAQREATGTTSSSGNRTTKRESTGRS